MRLHNKKREMRSAHFGDADLLVPLNPTAEERRPWSKKIASHLPNTYIGQLKLLATEIAFLSLGVSRNLIENCVVVYAGAAGGHHIPALASLYPHIKFFLYDPAPFAIKESPQLKIINGFFTDDIARKWGEYKEGNVIFICDIRTSGDSAEEHEAEVLANMGMQARWVDLMRPALAAYSLKFRIPYTIIDKAEKFPYLGGKLIFQPFPKPDSMELRLLGGLSDKSVVYDSKALEETVFYHNSVIRPNRGIYSNVFDNSNRKYQDFEFDNGYDCTFFLYCLKRWAESSGHSADEKSVLSVARRLISVTSQGRWTLRERGARR